MKKWLLTALCSLVAGSAFAGEWYFVGAARGYEYADLYDRSSVATENGVTQVWRLMVNSAKPAKKEGVDYGLFLEEINCKKKALRIVTFTYYRDGVNTYTDRSPTGKWEFVIPDTIGSHFLEQVCARSKEFYEGADAHKVAKSIRKWLDEEVAKSTPQKTSNTF